MMSDEEDLSYGGSDLEDFTDDPAYDQCKSSHKVITSESLALAQQEDLQKVIDMFHVKIQHARILLIYYRWDVDRLFSEMAEAGRDEIFLRAGLPALETQSALPQMADTVTCGICFEDVSQALATQMDCGHIFCDDCWLQNFALKIREGQSRRLVCMAHKCRSICDEEKVRKILIASGDQEARERYDRSLLESYIEDNAKVKWCPSIPHCGNAIKVEGEPYCEIECVCSQQFCFNCMLEPHSPCSCPMWQLWERKCKDESETCNWITVHTKSCPKCHKPVEKNEGCNLVTCVCGQSFCWLCGSATGRQHTWTHIEGHSCGRYKEDYEKKQAKAERFLKRYIHYHSRWKAHLDSLKFEAKQKQMVQEKIEKLEQSDSEVKDYTWLKLGLQMLYKARRALSYSYPFAFYMFGNDLFKDDISPQQNVINQNLFEDQQQQFESQVENLSKIIDTPMEFLEGNVSGIRFQLISATALTDKLCSRLYDLIENDLLDSLVTTRHHIAPYRSQIERACSLYDNEGSSTELTTEVDAMHVGKKVTEEEEDIPQNKLKRYLEDNEVDNTKRLHTGKAIKHRQ